MGKLEGLKGLAVLVAFDVLYGRSSRLGREDLAYLSHLRTNGNAINEHVFDDIFIDKIFDHV